MTGSATQPRSNARVALKLLGVLSWTLICAIGLAGSIRTMPARATIGAPPPDLDGVSVSVSSPRCYGRLAGWYFQGVPGRGAVLVLHGYRANRLSEISRVRLLRQAGFTVLAIDFRAHGESEGKSVSLGLAESNDVIAAVDWLRQRAPSERVGVIGTSMGGAAAIVAGPEINADAMVLESVYSDITTAIGNRLSMRLGNWSRWITPAVARIAFFGTGVDVTGLNLVSRIAAVRASLLIVAGDADQHATLAESRLLLESAKEPKKIWVVPGAAHVDFATAVPQQYSAIVVPFLTDSLTARRPMTPP